MMSRKSIVLNGIKSYLNYDQLYAPIAIYYISQVEHINFEETQEYFLSEIYQFLLFETGKWKLPLISIW